MSCFQAVISVEGKVYNVGGWNFSAIDRAYLNRTAVAQTRFKPDPESFQFSGFTQKAIRPRYGELQVALQ